MVRQRRTVRVPTSAAAHRVPGDRKRLGQGRDIGRQAIGDGHHERLLDDHLLDVGAWSVDRQPDRVDAVRAAKERPAPGHGIREIHDFELGPRARHRPRGIRLRGRDRDRCGGMSAGR